MITSDKNDDCLVLFSLTYKGETSYTQTNLVRNNSPSECQCAELPTEEYLALTSMLEGLVILKRNSEYMDEDRQH